MESFIQRKSNDCNEEGEEIYESLVLGRGEIVITREKEHMFDKVVTPSDVGKLNRLVIPKQYAEKYFPLDSSTNDNKGLLLNFEDRNGKPWRFRYSYWNSSQSYVMTKGWSRFVKDKKLDAGDIVSFLRGVGGGCGDGGDSSGNDLLFIDWRRRPETLLLPPPMVRGHQYLSFHHPYYLQQGCPHHQLHLNRYGMCMNENPFQSPYRVGTGIEMIQMMQIQTNDDGDEIDEDEERMVFESVPVVQGKAVGKRLRLFGVNMEYCPISESSEAILSSTAVAAGVNPPPPSSASSSSAAASLMPYSYIRKPLLQKMSSDNILNKGKGSLSLDFDV